MKGKIIAFILGVAVLGGIFTVTCMEKIQPGYVGVVYSINGGIEDEVLTQGWKFVPPIKKVKEFTISNEQLLLTKDEREGSETDESFKVTTADDATISVSFQMTYRYDQGKVVDTYKKFRGMDGEAIVNGRLKTVLKSKISEITTDYSMMDIYSGNRSEINNKITDALNAEFNEAYGVEVLDASIIDVHPDKKLQETIDNRVKALQEKQQAQAEQEKVKVEAETARIKAENEAAIKVLKAEAEAKANKVIAESISQELIDMELAEARKEHGWVEILGTSTVVKDK